MIWKIIVLIIGVFIAGTGIWYNKKYHNEKFIDNSFASTGSFIGDVITFLFFFIMGILPWYVFKTVIILSGLLLIYVVITS
ncbi:hypothetical protein [Metabacillus fastidiosus]|uniref:hypothetical protein n=1 Tax=Metabacillus fastidiosus TaxID=1458 RepID=UPI002DBC98E1|nr:hypothetical protein [Metabacillus fastidiosus]MEC2074595.1 hypothetical protein [Metabacillus fastidiosus]